MPFVLRTQLVFALSLLAFANISHAQIITGTDSSGRPLGISGFSVNSVVYDIDITYNNDGFTNPIAVGDLPESEINLAATDLASFLQAEDPLNDGAFLSIIFFEPSSSFPDDGDPLTLDAYANVFGDSTPSFYNAGVANYLDTMEPHIGFAAFTVTAVPEPSSFVLVGSVFSVFALRRRRH